MRPERVMYIHSAWCSVYTWSRGHFVEGANYPDDAKGRAEFRAYLAEQPGMLTAVLADIVEEEHYRDSIPKVGFTDQRAVLKRRIARTFPRTPYRTGCIQERDPHNPEVIRIQLSGLTRPDAIRGWMSLLDDYKVPVIGIYTPAMLAHHLLEMVGNKDGATLLSTHHSDDRVRHTFFEGETLVGTRRFKRRGKQQEDRAEDVLSQLESSLRHFNPSYAPTADRRTVAVRIRHHENSLHRDMHEVFAQVEAYDIRHEDINEVAAKLGIRDPLRPNQGERLFVQLLRRPPRTGNYAPPAVQKFYRHFQARICAKAASLLAAAIALGFATLNSVDILDLRGERHIVLAEAEALEAHYAQQAELASDLPADPLEMLAAVTAYRALAEHKIDPVQILTVISRAVETIPVIQIDGVKWSSRPADSSARPDDTLPAAIAKPGRVNVNVAGRVEPFDGDLNHAFAAVHTLIKALQGQTGVTAVRAITLPLEVDPRESIEGEVTRELGVDKAEFELRLTVRTDDETV